MIIVPAHRSDLAAIERMRQETFSHFAPGHYAPSEIQNLIDDFDAAQARLMIQQQALLVAKMNSGQVVACAGWHDDSIRHVYVMPTMAGKGIGGCVLSRAERDFRSRTGSTFSGRDYLCEGLL